MYWAIIMRVLWQQQTCIIMTLPHPAGANAQGLKPDQRVIDLCQARTDERKPHRQLTSIGEKQTSQPFAVNLAGTGLRAWKSVDQGKAHLTPLREFPSHMVEPLLVGLLSGLHRYHRLGLTGRIDARKQANIIDLKQVLQVCLDWRNSDFLSAEVEDISNATKDPDPAIITLYRRVTGVKIASAKHGMGGD
jgi:hypothetical protein